MIGKYVGNQPAGNNLEYAVHFYLFISVWVITRCQLLSKQTYGYEIQCSAVNWLEVGGVVV